MLKKEKSKSAKVNRKPSKKEISRLKKLHAARLASIHVVPSSGVPPPIPAVNGDDMSSSSRRLSVMLANDSFDAVLPPKDNSLPHPPSGTTLQVRPNIELLAANMSSSTRRDAEKHSFWSRTSATRKAEAKEKRRLLKEESRRKELEKEQQKKLAKEQKRAQQKAQKALKESKGKKRNPEMVRSFTGPSLSITAPSTNFSMRVVRLYLPNAQFVAANYKSETTIQSLVDKALRSFPQFGNLNYKVLDAAGHEIHLAATLSEVPLLDVTLSLTFGLTLEELKKIAVEEGLLHILDKVSADLEIIAQVQREGRQYLPPTPRAVLGLTNLSRSHPPRTIGGLDIINEDGLKRSTTDNGRPSNRGISSPFPRTGQTRAGLGRSDTDRPTPTYQRDSSDDAPSAHRPAIPTTPAGRTPSPFKQYPVIQTGSLGNQTRGSREYTGAQELFGSPGEDGESQNTSNVSIPSDNPSSHSSGGVVPTHKGAPTTTHSRTLPPRPFAPTPSTSEPLLSEHQSVDHIKSELGRRNPLSKSDSHALGSGEWKTNETVQDDSASSDEIDTTISSNLNLATSLGLDIGALSLQLDGFALDDSDNSSNESSEDDTDTSDMGSTSDSEELDTLGGLRGLAMSLPSGGFELGNSTLSPAKPHLQAAPNSPAPPNADPFLSTAPLLKIEDFEVAPGAEVKLRARLGKGATAIVWNGAVNTRVVAIKQIFLRKYKEGVQHAQLVVQREYQIVRGLDHPHIVRYYGMFYNKPDEEVNLVMEFIDGVTLTDLVMYTQMLSDPLVAHILRYLLLALKYLHGRGILHRDIKPDNIIISTEGIIKLIDFGTAIVDQPDSFKRRSTVGTPWYCAPEVINCEPYSSACDIWSVGCLTIEIASGKPPFDDLNEIQCLYKMAEGNPPPFPGGLSVGLEHMLRLVFAADSKKRPSAEALLRSPFLLVSAPADLSRRKKLLKYLDEMNRAKSDLLVKTMRVMKTKQHGHINISEWQ